VLRAARITPSLNTYLDHHENREFSNLVKI